MIDNKQIIVELNKMFDKDLVIKVPNIMSIIAGKLILPFSISTEEKKELIKLINNIHSHHQNIDKSITSKLEKVILSSAAGFKCNDINNAILSGTAFNNIKLLNLYNESIKGAPYKKMVHQLKYIFTGINNTPGQEYIQNIQKLILNELNRNSTNNTRILSMFKKPNFTSIQILNMSELISDEIISKMITSEMHEYITKQAEFNYLSTCVSSVKVLKNMNLIHLIAKKVKKQITKQKILDTVINTHNHCKNAVPIIDIIATFQKYNPDITVSHSIINIYELTLNTMDVNNIQYLNPYFKKEINEAVKIYSKFIEYKQLVKLYNCNHISIDNKKLIKQKMKSNF